MFYSSRRPVHLFFASLALPVNRKSPTPTSSAPRQDEEDEKRERRWRERKSEAAERPVSLPESEGGWTRYPFWRHSATPATGEILSFCHWDRFRVAKVAASKPASG